jgi:GntR family transcriptional regulator
MPRLSRRSSWPLYLQIADDLREQVFRQDLRPGERLPSEQALMDSYDASRQTVRKAAAVLKAEGLLDAAQGRGVFVREKAPLLRRLSRREWETNRSGGFLFEREAGGGPSVEKQEGRAPASAAVASRLGLRQGDEVVVWRWRVLSDDRPVMVSTSYLPVAVIGKTAVRQPEAPEDVHAYLAEELGFRVGRLAEHVACRMPQPAESHALDLGPGTPVGLITRTTLAADGQAVETSDTITAADRYELLYEIPASAGIKLVTSGEDMRPALLQVTREARECLVAVGSRSREPGYLKAIEQALEDRPELVHYRILIGPPHHQVFKDHLLRLAELGSAESRSHGPKTVFVGMVEDLTHNAERFFVASERAAVVMLPSVNSPANFDTAVVIGDPRIAQALQQHGRALYGGRLLESAEAVKALEVLQ